GAETYAGDLFRMAAKYNLSSRVSILSRWVSEEEKVNLFAGCLAAAYFPFDEDSYGYASLEAHHARKAVLTTTDSGGTLELLENGVNGLITPSDPELIGAAMDELYNDKERTRRMGEAGERRIAELGIHWDHVIARLMA